MLNPEGANMVRRHRQRPHPSNSDNQGGKSFRDRIAGVVQIDHIQSPPPTQSASQQPTQRVWQAVSPREAKQQWQQRFAADPIDLTHLPKPIVLKTRQILAALEQGVSPAQLQGRRFSFDRTLLRIPVGYRYRLLCRWYCDRIVPLQVLSHEAYNAVARNKKQIKG